MNSKDRNSIYALAIDFHTASGIDTLNADQSWHRERHLTPVQCAQADVANALFTLASVITQSEAVEACRVVERTLPISYDNIDSFEESLQADVGHLGE